MINAPNNPVFISPQEVDQSSVHQGVRPTPDFTGPQGAPAVAASPGAPGSAGVSAYCYLGAPGLAVPAGNTTQKLVNLTPADNGATPTTGWISAGKIISIGTGGDFYVVTVNSTSSITITNYAGNIPGTIIPAGAVVSPSGQSASYKEATSIVHSVGNTTQITFPNFVQWVKITKPTASTTQPDAELPDVAQYANQTLSLYNQAASARTLTVGAAGIQLINDLSAQTINIAVNTQVDFYSDGTSWYTK